MKLVMNDQEIMDAVGRDLEERGYDVGRVVIEWKSDEYYRGYKVQDGFVRIEAEVDRP